MICLVTDRRRLSTGADAGDRVVSLVEAAAGAGVDVIQIRERDLEAGELSSLARRCVDAVRGTHARVVVNDRVDVALAAGAHGVHLRSDSIEASAARRLLPPGALVGRSVHDPATAERVLSAGGVNYLIFGTLFPTASKSAPRLSTLDELTVVCRHAQVPVLAIGGMTLARAGEAARAGATGVAGIGLFIPPAGKEAGDYLHGLVSGLRRVFDTCGAVP